MVVGVFERKNDRDTKLRKHVYVITVARSTVHSHCLTRNEQLSLKLMLLRCAFGAICLVTMFTATC